MDLEVGHLATRELAVTEEVGHAYGEPTGDRSTAFPVLNNDAA